MKRYYTDLVDRAVRTAAQTAIVAIGADYVNAVAGVDWLDVAGFALGGAVLSVLTTLGQRGLTGKQ